MNHLKLKDASVSVTRCSEMNRSMFRLERISMKKVKTEIAPNLNYPTLAFVKQGYRLLGKATTLTTTPATTS